MAIHIKQVLLQPTNKVLYFRNTHVVSSIENVVDVQKCSVAIQKPTLGNIVNCPGSALLLSLGELNNFIFHIHTIVPKLLKKYS